MSAQKSQLHIASTHVEEPAASVAETVDREPSNRPTGSRDSRRLDDTDRENRKRVGSLLRRMASVTRGGFAGLSRWMGIGQDTLEQMAKPGHDKEGRIPLDKLYRAPPRAFDLLIKDLEVAQEDKSQAPAMPPRERVLVMLETLGDLTAEMREALADGELSPEERVRLFRYAAVLEQHVQAFPTDLESFRGERK